MLNNKTKQWLPMNSIPTPSSVAQNTVDIVIRGPIVDSSWWDENATTPQKIQDKLNAAGNVGQINVHINSPGGSVFAGQAIHNILRQHPANVTVYIDGLAASIASIIAMAGNKIIMPPGTMMMIHNPLLSLWGSYQSADMREMADFLDKVKESLVATYVTRCTKKTRDEIIALMDATTWMTAADAVEMGFADEVEGTAVTASMTDKVLNIAGKAFDLSPFATLPTIPIVQPVVNAVPIQLPKNNEEEIVLTLQELKNKYPELYNEIHNLGVQAERNRHKALDAIALPGNEALINKARYETGDSAEAVAVQVIAAEKARREQHLTNTLEDVVVSNLTQVPAAAAPNAKEKEEQEIQAAAKKIADLINEGRSK